MSRWPERSIEERFLSYAMPEPNSGCWIWLGTTVGRGYGQFYWSSERGREYAHRIAYELLRGPIPEGLEIDHLCMNRICVNPDHLEPVTCVVNHQRAIKAGRPSPHINKTTCINGHPYTPDNVVRVKRRGWRRCVICLAAERARAAPGQSQYRKTYNKLPYVMAKQRERNRLRRLRIKQEKAHAII